VWSSDLDVDLVPLSVGILSGLAPGLGLTGSVAGPVSVEGPLSALRVQADLFAGGGGLRVDGTIDATDPAAYYRLEAEADSLVLSELVAALPELTSWSGRLSLEGSGFRPDTVEARAMLLAARSRIGPLRVDTGAVAIRLSGGMLIADSLDANVGGLDVTGRGRLGLVEGRWGSAQFDFSGETLVGLRPLLMEVGDTVLVRDGLTELDQEFLRLQGIEPDTLPAALDVRLEGRVEGAASVSGRVGDIDVGMILDVVDGRYKSNQADTVRVGFTATNLPATTGAWQIGASARGIVWEGRSFERGGFEADMFELSGDGRVEVVRLPGEQYRAVGSFALDSLGGEIDLTDASVQIDEQRYLLSHDTRIHWDSMGVSVDSLEVSRGGRDPMYMLVDGVLARGGRSDFQLILQGLHAEQVTHLLQADEVGLGGHLDVDVRVRGAAEAPRIDGTFDILGARWGALELTRVEGTLDYDARRANFEFEGWDRTHSVLRSSGVFPVDLSLTQPESRLVDEPMNVHVVMDTLDAAIALSYLTTLEAVVGRVTGDVTVRGTPRAPEPDGTITLSDAAWSIEPIGVRHVGLNGVLTLRPDRTVDVDLTAAGPGRSEVTGTVFLSPFENPELDLDFVFQRFQAVARPDIEGIVSGSFKLSGRYRRPVATGALTVDVGTIYVDELQRAAGVVDLSDPFLFDQGLAVDTMALVSQPLFAGLRNPFFDNLRVDVDLSVPRGSWMRSIDTNVELSGDLLVRYDRSVGDFVLIGELLALRGSHRVLGRSFELDGGRVLFIGRPGLNPDLDIQASTRIRRPNDTPFRVQAQVSGTLVQPVVTLTTEETGLAEEDLVSYLVFGQPSSALGGRNTAQLGRVQGAGSLNPLAQGAVTFVGGAWANQFGTAFAQELGALSLDYVSVQQGGVQSLGGDLLGDTQLELGRYIGDDLFVIMVIRPFDTAAQTQNTVAGIRVEIALTDDYNVEMFFEDRFLRSTSSLMGTTSGLSQDQRVLGVFLFREWGYRHGGGSPPEP
jgi:autotransporter translocation and assembly factor TamB